MKLTADTCSLMTFSKETNLCSLVSNMTVPCTLWDTVIYEHGYVEEIIR